MPKSILFFQCTQQADKTGKDTNDQEAIEICWNFVSSNYIQSCSLTGILPSMWTKTKRYLTVSEIVHESLKHNLKR